MLKTARFFLRARLNCFLLIAFSCLPFGRKIVSLSFDHGSTLCNFVLIPEILTYLSLLNMHFHSHSQSVIISFASSQNFWIV